MVALNITAVLFAATNFDYLIAGGGTAGLTLAARLTEDPKIIVGVIEAGQDRSTDPKILTPGLVTSVWGDPDYDWTFTTTPQENANGRVISHPRGRLLGGSSGINLGVWTHASQRDINDWGELGNEGWSWEEIFPYFAKSEKYIPPSPALVAQYGLSEIDPSLHGQQGPVNNSFPTFYSDFQSTWDSTYKNLGITLSGDPKSGLALGPYENLVDWDPVTAARSFSATAYYLPNAERPNLRVLTGALVQNVQFAARKSKKEPLTATGLSFTVDGKRFIAKARREVILSAGTFQSPQLLELSGIGDKRILKPLGIDVLIENCNVGQNLQDHVLFPLGFQTVPGEITQESLRDPALRAAVFAQYAQNRTGPLATFGPVALLSLSQILRSIPEEPFPIQDFVKYQRLAEDTYSSGNLSQEDLTFRKQFDENGATGQILWMAGGINPQFSNSSAKILGPVDPTDGPDHYFSLAGVLEHPFSRGSVHITSTDLAVLPTVDPKYFSHPLDILISAAIALHMQALAQTEPLAAKLAGRGTVVQPGYELLNLSNAASQVKKNFFTSYHPLGTCAMLPAARGGVVDSRLKVYGTNNLRVVDASVFPLMVQSNLQTLVYAVAERAAEWIKEEAEEAEAKHIRRRFRENFEHYFLVLFMLCLLVFYQLRFIVRTIFDLILQGRYFTFVCGMLVLGVTVCFSSRLGSASFLKLDGDGDGDVDVGVDVGE